MGDKDQKFRYPQQHVRAGRGVPGFTGNVEVIPTGKPQNVPVVSTTGEKPKETAAKVDGLAARRALVAEAKELGLPGSGTNEELKAAIEAAKQS